MLSVAAVKILISCVVTVVGFSFLAVVYPADHLYSSPFAPKLLYYLSCCVLCVL